MSPQTGAKPRPTQGDVAKRAHVSQATVSYVLSNSPTVTVPDETRERVLAAARDLGYVPNHAARSLRTRRTMTIASIIPDITNPYYPWLERGIQDVANSYGYELIVYNTDGDRAREQAALRSVRRGHVDGMIMTPFHVEPTDLEPLVESGIQVVMLSQRFAELNPMGIDTLGISNKLAGLTAVNHLLDLGHTRIAMVAGVEGTPPRELRVAGYREALAQHHVPVEEQLIRAGEFSEIGGYVATRELLHLTPRPTAIFAANDLMAIGAMQALREANLSIPDDVALVGFDNIPASLLVHPSLTTVDQKPFPLGREAATILIERLQGERSGPATHSVTTFELIIRDST
ncbi:MAG TPA: LacI family DNA-binding transcriptional regulator [Thermomicrobiales bacterium]|nr:LacI family DNA-binding transcriptional regulator [Thermomicrobiales bacterium]